MDKIKAKNWEHTSYDPINVSKDEIEGNDFISENIKDKIKREEELKESSLSSFWSSRLRKKENPQEVVFDLFKIRETVKKLLQVHGIPKDLSVEIAQLGHKGAGVAGFNSIGGTIDNPKLEGPRIILDKTIYESTPEESLLDTYCGLALHEASHILHTRDLYYLLSSGKLSGKQELFYQLIEDSRIEAKVGEESPGFSPYITALHKSLFEGKELGAAQKKWYALPDKDKALTIMFSAIRMPHLLTKEMKEWKTYDGLCVYDEVKKALPFVPKNEKDVFKLSERVFNVWHTIEKSYDSLMSTKDIEELAKSLMKGKGSPSKESSGSGGGDTDGGGGDDEKSDSEDSSDTPKEPGKDVMSSEVGAKSDKENPSEDKKESKPKSAKDIIDKAKEDRKKLDDLKEDLETRKDLQELSEKFDQKFHKAIHELNHEIAEKQKELGSLKSSKSAKEAGDSMMGDSATVKNSDKVAEELKKLEEAKEKLEKERLSRGRFSFEDMKRMSSRTEKVGSTLSVSESKEMASVEAERIVIASESWSAPSYYGGESRKDRRVVIKHPEPTEDRKATYEQWRSTVAPYIARMKNSLSFRVGKREVNEYELSEGRLHRRMLSKASITDKVFTRKYVKQDKGIALCILLDSSGSMQGREKYRRAAETCILLAEALKGMPGIELEIYSFTSCGSSGEDCLINYLYGKKNTNLHSIGAYSEQCWENYDHKAIEVAAQLFRENTTNPNRLMLVVSDGLPAGSDYGGASAIKLTKEAVDEVVKSGIQVVQIAIDSVDSHLMYKRYVKFTDLPNLITQMRVFVTKVIKKATKG